jgi:hypothetical protein
VDIQVGLKEGSRYTTAGNTAKHSSNASVIIAARNMTLGKREVEDSVAKSAMEIGGRRTSAARATICTANVSQKNVSGAEMSLK